MIYDYCREFALAYEWVEGALSRQRREGGGTPGNEILLRQVRLATLLIYSRIYLFIPGLQNPQLMLTQVYNEMLLAMSFIFMKIFYVQIQIDHDQHWRSPIGQSAVLPNEEFFIMRSEQK